MIRLVVPIATRLLSVLVALTLIVVGVVLVVEVVAAAVGAGWTVLPADTADRLSSWRWDDPEVVVTAAVVTGVGVVAILVGLWRRPPATVPVRDRDGVAVERSALERSAVRQLEAVDGVAGARVRARRSHLAARVDTNRRHRPEDLKQRVEALLADLVHGQGVDLAPSVRLRYRDGEL